MTAQPTDIHSEREKRDAAKPLPLLRWSEIVLSAMAGYLVQGIIPRTGLTVVYGPPKGGKTFWLFDLVMHIALGWTYRGRRTQQGKVVYCLFEGQRGFAKRKEAFLQRHLAEDHDEPAFFLMPVRIDLVKDHRRLVEAIIAQAGGPVAVVVLDTLNRSFVGSESSDEAMTAYVAACDAIEAALGCEVILVHHSGLAEGRLRGHTSLFGSAACLIGVKRDAAENIVATVEHMKDGEAGAEIVSRLEQVTVGKDDEDDDITSCVVLPFDDGAVKASAAKTRRPQGRTGVVLRALEIAIEEVGEPAPASTFVPRTVRVVRLDRWRRYCEQLEFAETDNAASRLRLFTRERQKLQTLGFVGVWTKQAWLAN
jgi:hypothetical protein